MVYSANKNDFTTMSKIKQPKTTSFSSKRRLFKEYKKVLNLNRKELLEKHNLHIDWIYRIWKVYTVPIEERQNIYQYGQAYLVELVKKDIASIDNTMMNLGLVEIVGITDTDIIDDFNVRIVISYKYYNLAKRMNRRLAAFAVAAVVGIIGLIISI